MNTRNILYGLTQKAQVFHFYNCCPTLTLTQNLFPKLYSAKDSTMSQVVYLSHGFFLYGKFHLTTEKMYDSWSVEDLVFFLTFLKFSEQISCFSAIDTGTCLLIRSDTICSNLNFKDDSISKWNFWEVISSWGWRLHEKVSVLTTEALERSQASFYHMRTQQESPSFEPGRELSPKCDYAYLALVLDSQPPEP